MAAGVRFGTELPCGRRVPHTCPTAGPFGVCPSSASQPCPGALMTTTAPHTPGAMLSVQPPLGRWPVHCALVSDRCGRLGMVLATDGHVQPKGPGHTLLASPPLASPPFLALVSLSSV